MGCTQGNCHNKTAFRVSDGRSSFPILTGFLIAVIPKCPLCIAAYSSAIALCSGNKIYNQSPDWTNYISIALASLTLLMILLNFRGRRTWIAAALVIIGSILIIRTELITGDLGEYYLGASALLLGVWVNASFMFFYKKWMYPILAHLLSRE